MTNESSKRLLFIKCPAGHDVSPQVTREEISAACRSNRFEYFCIFCGQNWIAPPEAIEGLRTLLSEWS